MKKKILSRRITKRAWAYMVVIAMMASMTGCGSKKTSEEKSDMTTGHTQDNSYLYDSTDEIMYTTEAATQTNQGIMADSAACENDIEICEEPDYYDSEFNTNEFSYTPENSWLSVKSSPLSTFAADVDTAAYANIRTYINNGYEIDPSMVRIEEMINYFHYDYVKPEGGDKFAVDMEYADCPWNDETKLARISLATEAIDFSEAPASNIVFLVDTSGSMFDDNKLPLVQQSLMMLAENFTEKDRISIVTYAGADTVVLDGVAGDRYYDICSAIEGLEAYGSTNGSAGINTAYDIAAKHYIKGGNNRVILATDGDLNVGVTSESALTELIIEKKKTGVFLSVIGVGYGNYKDNKLETLADNGNGTYAYIDSIFEAKKTLVENLGASLTTVAKDVKLQVEFNPEYVKGYRLIGYENRVMAAEDFADDTKDGGEMGAGHTVTALYEIALVDSDFDINEPDLKYGSRSSGRELARTTGAGEELFTLNVRYKEPEAEESELVTYVCGTSDYSEYGSDNLRWAAAVAEFGLLLKDSEYKGNASYENVLGIANELAGDDEYRKEFISLVEACAD